MDDQRVAIIALPAPPLRAPPAWARYDRRATWTSFLPVTPDIFEGSEAYIASSPGPVVTIGNFDGVHLGHQALVSAARQRAVATGGPSLALTFSPLPREVLAPARSAPRLQTTPARVAALRRHGIDQVVVERFDEALAARDPEWFADVVLRQRLGARAVIVGWNFRFGKDRRGDADLLRSLLDAPVESVDAVHHGQKPVSSSRIRTAIGAGEVRAAAALLGRPYALHGTVVHGHQRGRELGFPTANIAPETAVPANGVYAVTLRVGDEERAAVANLGVRPTFDAGPRSVEVHVLDFDADLYDQRVRVSFIERIRGERKFQGRDALMDQIARDVEATRAALGTSPS